MDDIKILLAERKDTSDFFCDGNRIFFVLKKRTLLEICIYDSNSMQGTDDSAPRIFALGSKNVANQLEKKLMERREYKQGSLRIIK